MKDGWELGRRGSAPGHMYHWFKGASPSCGADASLSEVSNRRQTLPRVTRHRVCKRCMAYSAKLAAQAAEKDNRATPEELRMMLKASREEADRLREEVRHLDSLSVRLKSLLHDTGRTLSLLNDSIERMTSDHE